MSRPPEDSQGAIRANRARRAHNGVSSDLDRSPWTLSVGAAEADGSPFHAGVYFHAPTDEPTITIPTGATVALGGGESTGHSSAATAVASGVATMILDVAPELTSDRVHCLLREATSPPAESWDAKLEEAFYCRADSAQACERDGCACAGEFEDPSCLAGNTFEGATTECPPPG